MGDPECYDCAKTASGKTLFRRSAIIVRYCLVYSVALAVSLTTILSPAQADVVWLDFAGVAWPSFSGKVATDFEDAVLANVVSDYAEYPWLSFTKTLPGGPATYTQLEFSDPAGAGSFGSAHIVDWDNVIKNHNNVVRPDGTVGSAADVFVAGFVASGSPFTNSFDNFVTAVGATASHEMGHTLGLRHFDTFGPATVVGNPNPEADHHIMATATTGLSGTDRTDFDRVFSEHSRDKLHYLDPLNQPSRKRAEISPAAFAHSSIATAEALTIGPSDTIAAVGRQIMVKEATIAAGGESDYYSFAGTAGDKIYANVFSKRLRSLSNPLFSRFDVIDSFLTLIDPTLAVVYSNDDTGYNSTSSGTPGIGDTGFDAAEELYWASANDAAGDSPFTSQTSDSILIGSPTGDYFTLTSTGVWYLEISAVDSGDTGDYELFVSIEPIPEPSTLSLMGIGIVALVYWSRRRRRAAA